MKKVKSVAFNVSVPYEMALYEHALKQKYFSTYVKRLIARDMERGSAIDMSPYEEASKLYKEEDEHEED
ncbi:hypothetical protein CHCC5027_3530 [Bacillus paralicheniformis]|uniref:hypothetical protein n=1 Tax=Bacillus paralicheniformis TaxID=1648923 RepID=UPI0011A6F906|nr:hypothetical protein [Bacillus paralicheniformis]TWJ39617.1 hypothetical protein CHCC5027_3530 [Bacillus paralicheniformis]